MRAFLVVRHGDAAVVESLLSFPPLRPWLSSPSPAAFAEAPEGDLLAFLRALPEAFFERLDETGAERYARVYLDGFSLGLPAELLALLGGRGIALSVWRAVP